MSKTAAWNPMVRLSLTSLSRLQFRRRTSVFGRVARLDDDTPANMAIQLHINVSLNRPSDRMWRPHLVIHGTSGSTSYETIPPVRLETSRGVLSTVDMMMQRRNGPLQLRNDDDCDDECELTVTFQCENCSSCFRCVRSER